MRLLITACRILPELASNGTGFWTWSPRAVRPRSHRLCPAVASTGPWGGNVGVLLALVFGGLRFRFQKKSIGMLMVPSGRKLTERVAQMAVEGKIAPLLEAVLPLSSVPEALHRTGLGEVKGKLVIKL